MRGRPCVWQLVLAAELLLCVCVPENAPPSSHNTFYSANAGSGKHQTETCDETTPSI